MAATILIKRKLALTRFPILVLGPLLHPNPLSALGSFALNCSFLLPERIVGEYQHKPSLAMLKSVQRLKGNKVKSGQKNNVPGVQFPSV